MELRQSTIHTVQMLRAIAAMLVVFHHAYSRAMASSLPFLFDGESYYFQFGAVGVHLFFVISGFIMVMTCRAGPGYRFGAFFGRRCRRIYPIYWLMLLLYLGIFVLSGRPIGWKPVDLVLTALLWPNHAADIIGPAWTLSYEVYFYLCFGLAMLLGVTRGLIALALFFLVSIGLRLVVEVRDPLVDQLTNGLLLEFLGGSAIGWLALHDRLPLRAGALLTAAGAIGFLIGIAMGFERVPFLISWGLPSMLLLLGLVSWEARSGAHRIVRSIGLLGESSYILYLIHIAVIVVLFGALDRLALSLGCPAFVAALMTTMICVPLGEIAHRLVEKPLLDRLRARPRLRTAAAA